MHLFRLLKPRRYFSRLECNEDKGWTEELGNKVFDDPEAKFEIYCVEKSEKKYLAFELRQ